MLFDKGKKRRLIDNCGHERCYSCMFTNEACPLCLQSAGDESKYKKFHSLGLVIDKGCDDDGQQSWRALHVITGDVTLLS